MGVKPTEKFDWAGAAVVGGIVAVFFGGIGLAFWYEDATWLILSAIAFCVIYAG